nr:peptidoglycan-binding domain-containing protein [Futiania mangrovii]
MRGLRIVLAGAAALALAAPAMAQTASTDTTGLNLPPNAKPGQCFARVFIPPQYAEQEERVLIKPASQEVETIPAKYEEVEQEVLVEEASFKFELVEAQYDFVDEIVVVQEESTKLVPVPAEFEEVEEQVLVRAAYTTWQNNCGPIQKVERGTGETMCLVEVPAEYKTVSKRVMKTPAQVVEEVVPAVTEKVRKRIMVEPPKTVKVEIPAKYETIKVKKVVEPARQVVTEVPAEYETVTKRVKMSDGSIEWREILCEVNMTEDWVTRLQTSLKNAGYDPGKIDGVLGRGTYDALERFQKDKGLGSGELTIETLRMLGVNPA